jgi:isoquinoline 1-oxidoreductase beta subunit
MAIFTRRRFLVAGGLLVAFGAYRATRKGDSIAGTTDAAGANLDDYIHIAGDGVVTIRCGLAEMGQGVFTGVATLVAEELECDWKSIRVETGPVLSSFVNLAIPRSLLSPNHGFAQGEGGWVINKVAGAVAQQITGGSSSIADRFVRAREAGALARTLLVAAAAAEWGAPPDSCKTGNGIVLHEATHRQKSYGELANAAAAIKSPGSVALKPRSAWKFIGRSLPRVDIPAKTDGSAKFGIDMRRPGMLFGAVANCPIFGGKLRSFDATAAMKLPGVAGVHPVPGGIAVAADSTWRAKQGLAALTIDWDPGASGGLDSAEIAARLTRAADGKLSKVFEHGDADAATKAAAKSLSAEYTLPYLAHAPMEPMNCTAEVSAAGVEIWAPTQAHTTAVEAAAKAAGVGQDQVRLHTTYLGGGFGRRLETDLIEQAVSLAKLVGKPVQVIWSREEDLQHDVYRPVALMRLQAGLDASGAPVACRQQIVSQSILERAFPPLTWIGPDPTMSEGSVELPYAIPYQRVDIAVAELPVPVGSWRSVGHSITAFAKEGFIDEMAHAAGVDPVDYRLRLLKDQPRLAALLSLVAEKAGWKTPLPPGRGRGVAIHTSFATAVAEVVEVEIGASGALRVRRVVAAVDCGTVVNPDIVKAQVESGIVYGLSAALFGKITLKGGRVVEQNFPDYDVVHLAQAPAIEVHIVVNDDPPGGIGEPALPPVAPALANAIFAASGKRVRSLPLVDQGYSA